MARQPVTSTPRSVYAVCLVHCALGYYRMSIGGLLLRRAVGWVFTIERAVFEYLWFPPSEVDMITVCKPQCQALAVVDDGLYKKKIYLIPFNVSSSIKVFSLCPSFLPLFFWK